MFETTSLPIGWVGKINEVLDEVWVPNVFNKAVLLREGVTKPIVVIYEGISNSLPLFYCHEYKIKKNTKEAQLDISKKLIWT